MNVAGDEAGIKAVYFHKGTHLVFGFLSLIPLIYFVVLSIWWIFVKRELKRKLSCFCGVGFNTVQSRSQEFNDFPDRIENPSTYEAQAAPLFRNQKCGTLKNVKH